MKKPLMDEPSRGKKVNEEKLEMTVRVGDPYLRGLTATPVAALNVPAG